MNSLQVFKMYARFASYVNDPEQGVMEVSTLSDSANRRYTTQLPFTVRPANDPPGRCKRDLRDSTAFLFDACFL